MHYGKKLVNQINVNDKRFWNYTRHFTKLSSTIGDLNFEGKNFSDDQTKANILNNYFISVLTDESGSLHSLPTLHTDVKYTLCNLDILPTELRTKLTKLKPDKASGPDLLNVNVLRNCLDFDIPPAYIFNKSIQTSQIPQDWRDTNVTPIHKKGPRNKCNNFRPVSLTSQVIKLLETIIQDNMLKLADTNNAISCDQHGFQKKISCITQLLECLQDWTTNTDNSAETDVIYLDFSKAFDSVPHKRSIYKLRQCGIKGKVLLWIQSFLAGRRQRMVLRNGHSS